MLRLFWFFLIDLNIFNMHFIYIFLIWFILNIFIFPFISNSLDNLNINAKILTSLNNNIITWNDNLNSTFFVVKTDKKYTDLILKSNCNNSQKIIYTDTTSYSFNLFLVKFKLLDNFCLDKNIFVSINDVLCKDSKYRIKTKHEGEVLNNFLNYNNSLIKDQINITTEKIFDIKSEISQISQKNNILSKIKLVNLSYILNYKNFELKLLTNINEERENLRYKIPVEWKKIPTQTSLIPNALRSYRSKYTDWIHHWYDILALKYTPVIAVWKWVIIRILDNFTWENFDNIIKNNLTYIDKLNNLDIYRWNQVWLKTMDWNVFFYSHLNNVASDLYEWKIVNNWDILWFIGNSWIPDKDYKDYHLHFEIQINPFIQNKYSNLDIIQWDWFWKWKNIDWILKQNKLIFM